MVNSAAMRIKSATIVPDRNRHKINEFQALSRFDCMRLFHSDPTIKIEIDLDSYKLQIRGDPRSHTK